MNFIKNLKPEWPLRLGLGVMYLYSGFDIFTHPTAWHWAMPYWFKQMVTAVLPLNNYLKIQAMVEILFAILLLAWFLKPWVVRLVAILSTIEFGAILLLAFIPFNSVNLLITFRDLGLLGASLALYIIYLKYDQ